MPIKVPDAAGEPYQPANGTEGLIFFERFCDRCLLNDFNDETCEGGCEIQMKTMWMRKTDPGYPEEWIFDYKGEPTCTAFVEKS